MQSIIRSSQRSDLTQLAKDNADLAPRAMIAALRSTIPQVTTPDQIIQTVCEYYHVPKDKLIGHCRLMSMIFPRFAAMHLMRKYGLRFQKIGEVLGGRDHSTIMHGCEQANQRIYADDVFYDQLCEIEKMIVEGI